MPRMGRAVSVLERAQAPLGELVTKLPLDGVHDGFEALRGSYHLDGREIVKVAHYGEAR